MDNLNANTGGHIERVSLSTICATDVQRVRGEGYWWVAQFNPRIQAWNRGIRKVADRLQTRGDLSFKLHGVVDWYYAALGARRDALRADALHFTQENIYRQWTLELLRGVLVG
jgi:hypothetical protein